MNKIGITGSSGFVGKHLQSYLDHLYVIEPIKARYSYGQMFDIQSDVVIHLAGKAHDIKKVAKPADYYESNFELTKQLFDSFLNSDSKVFIFMSTVKAVADKVDGILNEDSIANPKTHYGIAKREAEEYILSRKLPEEKRIYILRPCMIHGAGNKGNLNLLYQLISKGIPWPLGNFENRRSFLSVENLCFVVKELLENPSISSGIYNVADNDSISTNKLINCLAESLGKKRKILYFSKNMITFISRLGDKLHLPLNTERLQKLTENYVVSNKKIIGAIGKSMPLSVEEGLRRTFISFKK